MKLSDIRKITVKKQLRIRFPLSNGMECVVNERGIAQVPALHGVPAFNLEDELTGAQVFLVEPAGPPAKDKDKAAPKARKYTRAEMTTLATASAGATATHDDHED